MNRHLRIVARSMAITIALFGLLGFTRTAGAQQPTEPLAVVNAFLDAFSRGDVDAMRQLADLGVRFVFEDPFSPTDESFDEFVAEPRETVVVNSITQTAPDTVTARLTISGADLPVLPVPIVIDTTWTVTNGKITREVSRFTPETLAYFSGPGPVSPGAQPGMPQTGQGEPLFPFAASILAVGLFCLIAGIRLRRGFAARP